MPSLEISGERIHAEISGPVGAPILMFSNSLGASMEMWDPQLAELSRDYRIVRYDSLGHGKSSAPDRTYTIDELGQNALAVIDKLGLEKVHWCGLSLGGMVGMWLLTHAPERIGHAILANTSAHMGPRSLWDDRIRAARETGMKALVDATLGRWFTEPFRQSGNPLVEKTREMILKIPPHGYAGCCAAIRDMDQRESIRVIANPVLVVIGSEDTATPPEAGHLIASRINGSRIAKLQAAHLSNAEQPDAFARIVRSFLSDCPPEHL